MEVDGWHIAFSQEVASAQPDELGFVGVQSKPIWRHPGLHSTDDVHGPGSQISSIRRLTGAMELGIVSVQMYAEPERYDQFLNIGCVQDVEERAEPWATPERTTAQRETDPQ